MAELLVDIEIDLNTGQTVIDPDTNDAALISGPQVILQNAAIRLKTQIGRVKRQELDSFGWDFLNKIKAEADIADIIAIASKIEETVLLDDRIIDASAVPSKDRFDDDFQFDVNIKIESGDWYALPFAIPKG